MNEESRGARDRRPVSAHHDPRQTPPPLVRNSTRVNPWHPPDSRLTTGWALKPASRDADPHKCRSWCPARPIRPAHCGCSCPHRRSRHPRGGHGAAELLLLRGTCVASYCRPGRGFRGRSERRSFVHHSQAAGSCPAPRASAAVPVSDPVRPGRALSSQPSDPCFKRLGFADPTRQDRTRPDILVTLLGHLKSQSASAIRTRVSPRQRFRWPGARRLSQHRARPEGFEPPTF